MSSSAANAKYGASAGSLGGTPVSCTAISPIPASRPARNSRRSTSGPGRPGSTMNRPGRNRSGAAATQRRSSAVSGPLTKAFTILKRRICSRVARSDSSAVVVAAPRPRHGSGRHRAGTPPGRSAGWCVCMCMSMIGGRAWAASGPGARPRATARAPHVRRVFMEASTPESDRSGIRLGAIYGRPRRRRIGRSVHASRAGRNG